MRPMWITPYGVDTPSRQRLRRLRGPGQGSGGQGRIVWNPRDAIVAMVAPAVRWSIGCARR
eukprot:11212391-Lingulodinium_polyedra.AAC.1